jgi:MSHA pilin protein MshC
MRRDALSGSRSRGAGSGFTLVELTMVLVLVGILAVVAMPRFFDRQVFDERGFFDESLAAVRYAHELALAGGCDVAVRFTAAGYALTRRDGGCTSGGFTVPVAHPTRGGNFAGSAPSGVAVGSASLYFDLAGRPHDLAGALLGASTDVGIGGLTLRVEPETGFAHEP